MKNKSSISATALSLLIVAGLGISPVAHAGTAGTIPPKNLATTLAQFRQGLKNLGSTQYSTRQAASANLRTALASLMAEMIRVGGPERQARVEHLLEYQADLSRWAQVLMQLPPPQRMAMLQWGTASKILPLVAGAFSHNPQRRADVAHALAKIPGPGTDWLLARLLRDQHRLVYITAMDAVWNRKPTTAMVKTLWRRAVLMGMSPYFQQNKQHTAIFRGQNIVVVNFNNNYWQQLQDGALATRVLVHWKPLQLQTLVLRCLVDVCRGSRVVPRFGNVVQNVINSPNSMQAKNFAQLAVATKRSIIAPYLLYLLHQPMTLNMNFNFNNTLAHLSNRTLPLLILVRLAGQPLQAYHLYKVMPFGGAWGISTIAQENAGIKAISTWYAKHGLKPLTQAQLHLPPAKRNTGAGPVQNMPILPLRNLIARPAIPIQAWPQKP